MSQINLDEHHKIHIVGIGGAGMSAIASVLQSMGFSVSGSDARNSHAIDRLKAQGIDTYLGHRGENIEGSDLLTYSSAVPVSNAELLAAAAKGIPVVSRSEILAAVSKMKSSVSIAGTHGKTTTTTMLGMILVEAQLLPSLIVGGDVNEIGTNAIWGEGDFLVVEADESDGTFLKLDTDIAVVTSIEADHLDFYGSFSALVDAYSNFLLRAHKAAVVCIDDEEIASLALTRDNLYSYGFSESADYRICNFTSLKSKIGFDILFHGDLLGHVELPVPGMHNARNAAAAIVAALLCDAKFSHAVSALSRFAGVARRFEFRGETQGITFVDDYAHLPGEIKATLAAAKQLESKRIVAVFQPHRYSRTASLASEFSSAFPDSDLTVITDIYPAGEKPLPGITGELIVNAAKDYLPEGSLYYCPNRGDLVEFLKQNLRPGDLCLTLSAGDLSSLPDEVMQKLTGESKH